MSESTLPRTGILAFMDDECRDQLLAYGCFMSTAPGQVVIEEGKPQTRLYLVISGSYTVTTQAAGNAVLLDTVEEGHCFGEVSLFQPGPASATVTSTQAGQLWYMESDHLQQFLFDAPHSSCALILGINTLLSRRLKRANAVIRANEIVPAFLSVRTRKRLESVH
jgi:CRP-like cAMP-binding protein